MRPSGRPEYLKITVIATSYTAKRLRDLSELLDSVRDQSYDNLEVVVVAEASRKLFDGLREYVSRNHMRNAKVIFNDGERGLSEARNLAIMNAKGDILAFADDDVVLAPDWAEEIVKTFSEDESVIALTGSAFPLPDEPSSNWLPEELDWLLSCTSWIDWKKVRDVRNVWGMNMAFRKEAFEVCGLFPTQLGYHRGPMAEDIGFSMIVRTKMKKRIVFNPKIRVWHKVHGRVSWAFITERAYWIGHSRRMLKIYYPHSESEDLLSMEHELLRRIVTRLLPRVFSSLTLFAVTVVVLSCVSIGYVLPGLPLSRRLSPRHRAS